MAALYRVLALISLKAVLRHVGAEEGGDVLKGFERGICRLQKRGFQIEAGGQRKFAFNGIKGTVHLHLVETVSPTIHRAHHRTQRPKANICQNMVMNIFSWFSNRI